MSTNDVLPRLLKPNMEHVETNQIRDVHNRRYQPIQVKIYHVSFVSLWNVSRELDCFDSQCGQEEGL